MNYKKLWDISELMYLCFLFFAMMVDPQMVVEYRVLIIVCLFTGILVKAIKLDQGK